jgi:uncharacterized membrane protein YjgN (DUF898 family)
LNENTRGANFARRAVGGDSAHSRIVFSHLVIFNLSSRSSPFLVALLVLLVTGHS